MLGVLSGIYFLTMQKQCNSEGCLWGAMCYYIAPQTRSKKNYRPVSLRDLPNLETADVQKRDIFYRKNGNIASIACNKTVKRIMGIRAQQSVNL